MTTDIALRIMDLALLEAGAKKYRLSWHTHTEAGKVEMAANEIAVSVSLEVRTEDTDFEVGITSDVESIVHTSQNCMLNGQAPNGVDSYFSQAAALHRGGMTIETAGTPAPTFILNYIKAIIEEYAAD